MRWILPFLQRSVLLEYPVRVLGSVIPFCSPHGILLLAPVFPHWFYRPSPSLWKGGPISGLPLHPHPRFIHVSIVSITFSLVLVHFFLLWVVIVVVFGFIAEFSEEIETFSQLKISLNILNINFDNNFREHFANNYFLTGLPNLQFRPEPNLNAFVLLNAHSIRLLVWFLTQMS